MTVDEALQAATRLLEQRGQLLNAHLFRLVEGDKTLFQEVRDRLVQTGVAEDRGGVGLVAGENPTSIQGSRREVETYQSSDQGVGASAAQSVRVPAMRDSREESSDWTQLEEWWLMSSGRILGPLDLVTLCQLRQSGELQLSDVVRCGSEGRWQHPDEVPLLAASKSKAVTFAPPLGAPTPTEKFVPVEKNWNLKPRTRFQRLAGGWNVAAGIVGGSTRLKVLIGLAVSCLLVHYWWQMPPSPSTVYREFVSCRAYFKKLQDRRVKLNDWNEAASRYRPRIQYLLQTLKPRATARHPLEQALYAAGTCGVIQAIEGRGVFNDPDPEYDKYMKTARDLLDGVKSD